MKSSHTLSLALSGTLALAASTQASAAEGDATFWVDHDILVYRSSELEPKTGESTKDTGLVTTPNDVTIGIFWKQFGLYVTPGASGGLVKGSFYPTKEVEVGLQLGLNNAESKTGPNKTETKGQDIGLFGTYYLTVSDRSVAEFTLDYLMRSKEIETSTTAGTTKTEDSSGNLLSLTAQYAFEVAKHFWYVPGIMYQVGSDEDDAPTPKTEDDISALQLNIAHFRYVF